MKDNIMTEDNNMAGKVDKGFECPKCGENECDNLVFDLKDGEIVTCSSCGKTYKIPIHCFEVAEQLKSEPTYVVDKLSTRFHNDGDIVVTLHTAIPLDTRETLARIIASYLNILDKKGSL